MNTQNNQPAIPDVLKIRLSIAGCLVACVLAAGVFMEYQMGDGFLKLSCLCSICLGIHFFDLFRIIYYRKYEVIEGEVVRIQICRKRKKEWEVTVRNQCGKERTILVPEQSNIWKGMRYRIYWRSGAVLGIEKQEI